MGYGTVSRLFHWATVAIVLIMIPVGLTMVQDVPRPIQDKLFVLHKGMGAFFLALILARIAWRLFTPAPPAPPLGLLQRRLAGAVHVLLYALLMVMAVSGYTRVTAGGFPIELLNAFGIPPLLPRDEALANAAKAVHATSIWALITLILGHVGAAIVHAAKGDGIMARMWPPIASPRESGGAA